MVRPQNPSDNRIPQACEQVAAGITDVEKLIPVIADSSAVIYCAGSVRGRNPDDFKIANIAGVKAMVRAVQLSGNAPQILLLSSLAASRPGVSDYAQSKHEGEQVLLGEPSLPWTIIRPPAVYGPGDREMQPILKLIRRGLLVHAGPRDQRLSLLHVDDLVKAIIAWLDGPQRCLHQTYSIDDGTRDGYSWQDIGHAVSDGPFKVLRLPRFLLEGGARLNTLFSRLLGYPPMLTPGKVCELIQPHWLCDNQAFTQATAWQPELDLSQGTAQLFGSKTK